MTLETYRDKRLHVLDYVVDDAKEKLRIDTFRCINEQLNYIDSYFNEIDEKLKTCKTEYEEQILFERRFEYEEQYEELENELYELNRVK